MIRNGYADLDEVAAGWDRQHAQVWIDARSTDGDGRVSLEEFLAFQRAHAAGLAHAALCHAVADCMCDAADHDAALKYLQVELDINEKAYGLQHPDTADSHRSIALVYQQKGELETALAKLSLSLSIKEASLGEEHADTIELREAVAAATEKLNAQTE